MTKTLLAVAALAILPTRLMLVFTSQPPFDNDKPVRFTEPTLGCPNVDDAVEAYSRQPIGRRAGVASISIQT